MGASLLALAKLIYQAISELPVAYLRFENEAAVNSVNKNAYLVYLKREKRRWIEGFSPENSVSKTIFFYLKGW